MTIERESTVMPKGQGYCPRCGKEARYYDTIDWDDKCVLHMTFICSGCLLQYTSEFVYVVTTYQKGSKEDEGNY